MSHPPSSAVIDPTILVSAAIAIDAGRVTPSRIVVEDALVRRGVFEHFTSAEILYELGDVLARARIPFSADNIVEYVSLVERASTVLTNLRNVVMGCRDPRDDKVLECAMNGPARYIVTRDKDLLEASPGEKYAISKVGPGIRDRPIEVVTAETFVYDVLGYGRAIEAARPTAGGTRRRRARRG
jgi:putative PIN family toxin of toxin-antitoxin system